MATKKSRLVIAFILILTMVSFFSIPASVFASNDDKEILVLQTEETNIIVLDEKEKDKDKEEPKTYTVTYNMGGGDKSTQYAQGDKVYIADYEGTLPNGKAFTGWKLNGNDTDLGLGNDHLYLPNQSFTMPDNNLNFKAQFCDSYNLTINYVYVGGATAAPTFVASHIAGDLYSVLSPVKPGFTASQLLVSGTMPATNVAITVTYTVNTVPTYGLTINYIYVGGASAATSHTAILEAGAPYSITSPSITGFTPDLGNVSGAMPESNVTVTVTYTSNSVPTYDITINYIYQGGASAATSHTAVLAAGVPYSVTSPAITGFTPNLGNVSGTMPESNVAVTVTYTANSVPTYNLTINYIHEGGASAATSHTAVLAAGVPYSVTSPAITGFTPDLGNVSGTMPENNVSRTVTYYANSTEPNTFTINYVALEGGSILGTSIQHLASGLTTSEVVATPNSGYHFVSWDNASTVANRSDLVSADATYTATFAADVVETTTRQTTRSTPDVSVIIEPEAVPAGPVVIPVIDEPVPAAPLPKTGGLDPGFLYGLGALLAGSGLVIKRRKDK